METKSVHIANSASLKKIKLEHFHVMILIGIIISVFLLFLKTGMKALLLLTFYRNHNVDTVLDLTIKKKKLIENLQLLLKKKKLQLLLKEKKLQLLLKEMVQKKLHLLKLLHKNDDRN